MHTDIASKSRTLYLYVCVYFIEFHKYILNIFSSSTYYPLESPTQFEIASLLIKSSLCCPVSLGTCSSIFIDAIFTISKKWKQPRYPPTDKWIMKIHCVQLYNGKVFSC